MRPTTAAAGLCQRRDCRWSPAHRERLFDHGGRDDSCGRLRRPETRLVGSYRSPCRSSRTHTAARLHRLPCPPHHGRRGRTNSDRLPARSNGRAVTCLHQLVVLAMMRRSLSRRAQGRNALLHSAASDARAARASVPGPQSARLRPKAAIGAAENDGGKHESAASPTWVSHRSLAHDAHRAVRSRRADPRRCGLSLRRNTPTAESKLVQALGRAITAANG
jgi:hypothetical protein